MKETKKVFSTRGFFAVGPTQNLEDEILRIKTMLENSNPGLIVEIQVSEGKDQAMNPGTFRYEYTAVLLRELD